VSRSSQKGAPGHAMGLRRGTVSGSCCWRSTACVAAAGGARAERGGVAHSGEDNGEELGRRPAGEQRVGAARSRRWSR
jgi:hypothetical protein